jgi:hypothetical protein
VIPNLERPFANDTAIGVWVLKQCPDNYAVEARSRYEAMADKTDPLNVLLQDQPVAGESLQGV